MRLYFLRHAAALDGMDDALRPLSATGRQQARTLARFLRRSGITFDLAARELRLDVADDELQRRLAAWAPPAPAFTSGVMAKYARLVSSASEGAVTG